MSGLGKFFNKIDDTKKDITCDDVLRKRFDIDKNAQKDEVQINKEIVMKSQ